MADMLNPLRGGPPTSRLRRAVLRAPIFLYRVGLGWLFGRRLVLLTHIGRVSGEPRQVMLEVVEREPEQGRYLIASGYGSKSQWFRNVLAQPAVRYQVGRRTYTGTAVPLESEESGRRLAEYAQHHPRLANRLMSTLGHEPQSSADYVALGTDRDDGVPLVRLSPENPA